mgnify:CR=1 FL=1
MVTVASAVYQRAVTGPENPAPVMIVVGVVVGVVAAAVAHAVDGAIADAQGEAQTLQPQ